MHHSCASSSRRYDRPRHDSYYVESASNPLPHPEFELIPAFVEVLSEASSLISTRRERTMADLTVTERKILALFARIGPGAPANAVRGRLAFDPSGAA